MKVGQKNRKFEIYRKQSIDGLMIISPSHTAIALSLQKHAHVKDFSKVVNIENFQQIFEAVLTNTYNLCFGAKMKKIGIPLYTPVLLYKSGV